MNDKRNSSDLDRIWSRLDPKLFPSRKLLRWLVQPRHPVVDCDDDLVNLFIESMLTGEPVHFIYIGGSEPGSPRRVQVSLVFQHKPAGRIYVSGYCLARSAHRVFALDLIMMVQAWN